MYQTSMSGKGQFKVKITSDILLHSLFLANVRRDHVNAQLNYRFLCGLALVMPMVYYHHIGILQTIKMLGNIHFGGRMAAHIHSLAR